MDIHGKAKPKPCTTDNPPATNMTKKEVVDRTVSDQSGVLYGIANKGEITQEHSQPLTRYCAITTPDCNNVSLEVGRQGTEIETFCVIQNVVLVPNNIYVFNSLPPETLISVKDQRATATLGNNNATGLSGHCPSVSSRDEDRKPPDENHFAKATAGHQGAAASCREVRGIENRDPCDRSTSLKNVVLFENDGNLNSLTPVDMKTRTTTPQPSLIDNTGRDADLTTNDINGTRNEDNDVEHGKDSENKYECWVCCETFSELCDLQSHERIHAGESLYIRHVDGDTSSQSCNVEPHVCIICSEPFPRLWDLRRHERIHKGRNAYKCGTCSKAFSTSTQLRRHEDTHSGEKPFICKTCSKAFRIRAFLRSHERTHTGEKPYTCDTCSKSFSQSCALKNHQRTHTGEKPYKCSICSKSFAQSTGLQLHERKHTGEKPYACNICGKEFAYASCLRGHERTHTGEKPFICNFCSKAFSFQPSLRVHERTHTGEKPFTCNACSKSFSDISHLQRHKRTIKCTRKHLELS